MASVEELILAKDRPEKKAQRRKLKRLLLYFEFSMLTHESSPVETIASNLLCGMKASFKQYFKRRIMATA